jgi:N-acetylmuramoyl-L-alanine amidase
MRHWLSYRPSICDDTDTMRLHKLGDSGRSVRDIQDRLTALGCVCLPDAPGEFGDGTHAAVSTFQKKRGLAADGIVGPDTWRALWEASYKLGDRLLLLQRPMMRGDDVADLQRQLNALGFDAGKVDGILGPDSRAAVLEFQHNRGMAEDGICGPGMIAELAMVSRGSSHIAGREAVRDRQWLRQLPNTVVGSRIYLDAGCRDDEEADLTWPALSAAAIALQERGGIPVLSRSADTQFPERVRARRANRLGAGLVVSFQTPYGDEPGVYFFASDHSRSEAGERIAAAIAAELGLPTDGRAPAMLKDTRAPSVVVMSEHMDAELGSRVVEALCAFFAAEDAGA